MMATLRPLEDTAANRIGVQCPVKPHSSNVRRGFHRATLLRLADETKSETSVPPPSFHEANSDTSVPPPSFHEAKSDTSVPPPSFHEDPTAEESSTSSAQGESTDDGQPNTSFQDQAGEHGEDYETEEQLQARILTAALEFVPVHGWTVEAIAAGAETLGLSSASTGMFNNGAGDLVLHFIAQCNTQLAETLAEQHNQVQLGQTEAKKTAEFLKDAAMSILLLPHNIPDSLKHLSTMVDDIWYYAGDRSTDVNWYTKRASLTGIYNTTELVMVQDSSPDYEETWAFLDNRIKDVVNIANTAKQIKNLTGMNQRR
ncbi:hypothetical protein DNTS_010881 [Danionella cerebrum]|uniref:Ubiquinone biosynthesis protein n=1 Tax=Danionella cerebrum TaxID=2873325 RepID=A0A553PE62_9TELE|nr:hypothetical protein DNTS_010881 [Danionella translucida]